MKAFKYFGTPAVIFILSTLNLFAQDKEANIKLTFVTEDSINVCKALVTSDAEPVKEINVKLYVKRLFGLLPVGDASTDEEGIASFEIPNGIPGDKEGKLLVVAKIEDDENYINTETKSEVQWGKVKVETPIVVRSLSASRSKAPIYFIVVANVIIMGIWGTLVYVVLQLFKMKKLSK